jgi:hypothetical protein
MTHTEIFTQHQNMIRKFARNAANRWGVEYEELEAQGHMIFVEALQTYDPSRSKFGTYLWGRLMGLYDHAKRLAVHTGSGEGEVDWIADSRPAFEAAVEFREMQAVLSPRAQEVLHELLEGALVFASPQRPSLTKAVELFRRRNWTAAQTRRAWWEVEQWVGEVAA